MAIPIHIPIGTKRSAVAHAVVWKVVDCDHCHKLYACQVELSALGRDVDFFFADAEGSRERAQAQANANLLKQTQTCVAPIPCPHCGNYQQAMARQMKENAWMNREQVVGGAIALASLIFLALPFDYAWIATAIVAAIGVGVVAHGLLVAYRYDANGGDPEPRKALARSQAVWGEKLDELIAAAQRPAVENARPAAFHLIKPI